VVSTPTLNTIRRTKGSISAAIKLTKDLADSSNPKLSKILQKHVKHAHRVATKLNVEVGPPPFNTTPQETEEWLRGARAKLADRQYKEAAQARGESPCKKSTQPLVWNKWKKRDQE
jgi:hypothetical protein